MSITNLLGTRFPETRRMERPKKKVRYEMEEEELLFLKLITDGNLELQEAGKDMFIGHRAKGTMEGYNIVQKRFKTFCDETTGLSYKVLGIKEVSRYVIDCKIRKVPYSYWMKLKPAIVKLLDIRNVDKDTVFTTMVDKLIQGGKREASERRPPVKKMEALAQECIEKGLKKYVWPYVEDVMKIDLMKLRILFRWVVARHTLCRFDSYSYLQAKHFEVSSCQTAINVTFPKGKTDQFRNGEVKPLYMNHDSVINPMLLTLVYFQRCGYSMDQTDESYINCMIKRTKQGQEPIPDRWLSAGTAKQQGRALLEELGFDGSRHGNTSAKRGGVTDSLRGGASVETLQQVGLWKTAGMPLYYAKNDEAYKIQKAWDMKLT